MSKILEEMYQEVRAQVAAALLPVGRPCTEGRERTEKIGSEDQVAYIYRRSLPRWWGESGRSGVWTRHYGVTNSGLATLGEG